MKAMRQWLKFIHMWTRLWPAAVPVVLWLSALPAPVRAAETAQADASTVATDSSFGPAAAKNDKVLSPVPGIALLGTGGALVLTSIITGSLALSLNSDLQDKCPGGGCYAPYHDDVDRLDTLAAVTDVFIPLGVTLLIAGAVTLLASKQTARKYGDKPVGAGLAMDRLQVNASGVTWRF